MASKKELKEIVKNYIFENYSRLSEEDKDGDGIEDEVDPVIDGPTDDKEEVNDSEVQAALQDIVSLLDASGERVNSILRQADSTESKISILNKMVDFILDGFSTREDLPNSVLRNFFIKKFGSVDADVYEESTTAGAPAPATKYAFRRKKK
jgi:hypothetical protein